MKLLGRIPEALCVFMLVMLVGEACTHDKALIITGESLVALGVTFEATAAAMEKALDDKTITPATYKRWRAFGEKFVVAYPLAAELWKTAEANKDENLQRQAGAAVAQLGTDLAEWAALVGVK